MGSVRHMAIGNLPVKEKKKHPDFQHIRRDFVSRGQAKQTQVSIYEIPPGKSAYPMHYHLQDEETFFVLSGTGILRTPEGEREVKAGELIFFPAGPEGAHRLINASESEKLVYIDFDVIHDLDVAVYPDSGKIGVWGMGVNQLWRNGDSVAYYDGE